MNNKNIFKYLIIIAIVVLVIVATVLIILNTKVKNPNIQEDVGEEDLPELEIDESIEKMKETGMTTISIRSNKYIFNG